MGSNQNIIQESPLTKFKNPPKNYQISKKGKLPTLLKSSQALSNLNSSPLNLKLPKKILLYKISLALK